MSDRQKDMEKVQEAGTNFGKASICTISYADDVVLLTDIEEEMRDILKKKKSI